MADRLVLDDDLARRLEALGLARAPVDGKRKLSSHLISPPSSRAAAGRGTGGGRVGAVVDEVELPLRLHSRDTYVFIGFTDDAADRLWECYRTCPADAPWGFLDFAWGRVEPVRPDPVSEADDWWACMSQIGLGRELQQAIMDPAFEHLRYTASCKFWVHDALTASYDSLAGLDLALRALLDDGLPAPWPGQVPAFAAAPPSRPPADSGVAEWADECPGHIVLWRAAELTMARSFYDEQTTLFPSGHMACCPSDFSGLRRLFYFTPDRHLAELYADWAKVKSKTASIGLIRVSMPTSLLSELAVQYLVYGEAWRTMVWHARTERRLPERLRHVQPRADVIVGPILSARRADYNRIQPQHIREEDCLRLERGRRRQLVSQWAFCPDGAADASERACRGKIRIANLGAYFHAGDGRG